MEPGAVVVTPLPKAIEHAEPGGVNLNHAELVVGRGKVGVEPPSEAFISPSRDRRRRREA